MIKFINNLKNVEMGEQFLQDNTGKIKIECKVNCIGEIIKVYDFETGIEYFKQLDKETPAHYEFRFYVKENNINNVYELIDFLASIKSGFTFEEFDKKKEFNPFIKLLDGELKIKSKDGHFNKAQVKKILCHKDTEVIIKQSLSDDYLYDSTNNYFKGVKVENIDALEDVTKYFKASCSKYDGKSFDIFVAGYSTIYTIKNNHITLL